MTNEEINRTVAESVGWQIYADEADGGVCWHKPHEGYRKRSPDYCNDLNAMHEVEMLMRGTLEQFHNDWARHRRFSEYQYRLMSRFGVSATARQRAEQYLRTIGKWREA